MKLLVAVIAAGGLLAGLAGTLFANHSYTVTAYFLKQTHCSARAI